MKDLITYLKKKFGSKAEIASEKAIDLGSQLLVAGDSHVRSYALNENFFPVFLGQGRLCNFTSDECAELYRLRIFEVLRSMRCSNALLVIGEPDTRFSIGCGWIPWESPELLASAKLSESVINQSIDRIKKFHGLVSSAFPDTCFWISPVFAVRLEEQIPAIQYFNELLKSNFPESLLQIEAAVENDKQFLSDHVHQSNEIQPLIEKALIKRGVITESKFSNSQKWEPKKIHDAFKANERFGCFMFKNPTEIDS